MWEGGDQGTAAESVSTQHTLPPASPPVLSLCACVLVLVHCLAGWREARVCVKHVRDGRREADLLGISSFVWGGGAACAWLCACLCSLFDHFVLLSTSAFTRSQTHTHTHTHTHTTVLNHMSSLETPNFTAALRGRSVQRVEAEPHLTNVPCLVSSCSSSLCDGFLLLAFELIVSLRAAAPTLRAGRSGVGEKQLPGQRCETVDGAAVAEPPERRAVRALGCRHGQQKQSAYCCGLPL